MQCMLQRVGSPVVGQIAECRPIVFGSRAGLKPSQIVADSVHGDVVSWKVLAELGQVELGQSLAVRNN